MNGEITPGAMRNGTSASRPVYCDGGDESRMRTFGRRAREVALLAGAGAIAIFFFYFAGEAFYGGFNSDDLMNLHGAWTRGPVRNVIDSFLFFLPSPTYRPVGAVLYDVVFLLTGFQPLPYHIVCWALLLANLLLLYYWVTAITGKPGTAILAALLLSYHGELTNLYVWTGLCYDVLAFFFYYSAFVLYLYWPRRDGRIPRNGLLLWCALYILALRSKEMAVSLPVVVLLYELIFHPPRSRHALRHWITHEGLVPALGAIITLAFLIGRIGSPDSLIHNPAYRPHLSLRVYFDGISRYFWAIAYRPGPRFGMPLTLTVLGAWILLSIRSRVRLFAGLAFFAAILPVVFIWPRELDSIYVALPPVALFGASLITGAFRRIIMPKQLRPAFAFALTLVLLWHVHRPYRIERSRIRVEADRLDLTLSDLTALKPLFKPGTRVLVLRDFFPPNSAYSILFAARIAARTLQLDISRIDALPDPRLASALRGFDVILTVRDGHIRPMPKAEFDANCLEQIHTCTPLVTAPNPAR